MKKFLNVLGNVFTVLILVIAITMTVMVITSVHSEDRVPNLFGYALMNVETDSMEAEGGFYVGDMIIVHMIDKETANHLKVGDVITFRRYEVRDGVEQEYLETHRIVENNATINSEYNDHKTEIVDGVYVHGGVSYYITKGDNTPSIDTKPATGEIEYSHAGNIVGVWEGTRIPVLGSVMKFLRSQMGFLICIVIPVAVFFIYELYVFIMTIMRKQKEKALEEVSGKEEELKQKAIAEFLAQQQKEGGNAAAADSAPADDAAAPAAQADAPAEAAPAEPAADDKPADISEAEKDRIIREYLAKQAAENKGE